MTFVLFNMFFGILVFFHETETATSAFVFTPPNPSYAVEGRDFTLKWNYTLDGSLIIVKFSNVTGGGDDPIGSRNGPVPPIVTAAQKIYVGREQSASLNCAVEGNPTPTISWSPCDVENLLCNKQYLSIPKVKTGCANYTCTATNALGADSATTVLLIGGKNIYLRLSVSGECDKNVTVWKTLEKELPKVFANTTQNYSGAELLRVRCGSLIFDMVFKFSTVVAEDKIFSIIQNAAANGKLGKLNVTVSHDVGVPPDEQTKATAPTSITSKPDDHSSSNLIVTGVSIGVGVLIAVVVGSVILCLLMRRNSRKQNTKGDYGDAGSAKFMEIWYQIN